MQVLQSRVSEGEVSRRPDSPDGVHAYDSENHAKVILPPSPEACHEENQDRDRDCSDSQSEFCVMCIHNNN